MELWVNDVPVPTVSGVRFANNGDLIDTLMFSTFHGGADPEWAPDIDSFVNFDDFKVGTSFEAAR